MIRIILPFTQQTNLLAQRLLYRFNKSRISIAEKYRLDYQYFKNIKPQEKADEYDRIAETRQSEKQFARQFIKFPSQEEWVCDKVKLMVSEWQPQQKPKAIIFYLHSMNGHVGESWQMAQNLAKKGYLTTGFDFPNHGLSSGQDRGLIDNYQNLVVFAEKFMIRLKEKYPGKKIFVSGLSLGGAIALQMASKNSKIDGIIFLSPSIKENPTHIPLIKNVISLLSIVFPRLQLKKGLGSNGSKYKLNKYYEKQDLTYRGRVWVKTVSQMMIMMIKTQKVIKQLKCPYLFIQSGNDKLIDPFQAISIEDTSPSKDKKTVIIFEMWHSIWFDDRAGDVIKIIEEWLDSRY